MTHNIFSFILRKKYTRLRPMCQINHSHRCQEPDEEEEEDDDDEEEEGTRRDDDECARASERLLAAREALDDTIARARERKCRAQKMREDEEAKREESFDAGKERLLETLRELNEIESAERRKEYARKETHARVERGKAAKRLEDAVKVYDREVGEKKKERKEKREEEEEIERALREVEKTLEEVKMENDREDEAEKARDEGIADEFNQARAARVIQKAFRSKKRKKKLNKRRKKGTKTTKSATKRKGKEKKK